MLTSVSSSFSRFSLNRLNVNGSTLKGRIPLFHRNFDHCIRRNVSSLVIANKNITTHALKRKESGMAFERRNMSLFNSPRYIADQKEIQMLNDLRDRCSEKHDRGRYLYEIFILYPLTFFQFSWIYGFRWYLYLYVSGFVATDVWYYV